MYTRAIFLSFSSEIQEGLWEITCPASASGTLHHFRICNPTFESTTSCNKPWCFNLCNNMELTRLSSGKPLLIIAKDDFGRYMLLDVLLKRNYRFIHANNACEAVLHFKKYRLQIHSEGY